MKIINKKKVSPIFEYVYYNQEIMKYEDATIGLGANSLQYGTSIFGGIRGYVNNDKVSILRLKDHHKRLMDSSKIMALGYEISYEKFKNIIFKLIVKNQIKESFYIRPFVFCDQTFIGPKVQENLFDLAIYIQSLATNVAPQKGVKLMISSFVKYSDNAISTKSKVGGSYVNSMLANHQAKISGFDDALLFNQNGYLAEASVANVIVIKDSQIFIPSTADCALEGITLRTCMEILKWHNISFSRQHIDRSTLYSADYVLLCGTAVTITFANEIDGRKISSNLGEIGALLQKEYNKIIANKHELSQNFMETNE